MSQQIVRLEESLGSKLFDRLGRGVRLTESGQTLLPQALEILRQVNGARTKLEALRQDVGGRLVIGCIPTITPYFLAEKLKDFARQYPEVDVRLTEEITPNLVSLAQGGELDIAVISPPVNNPDIVCSDLFREPILVAVGSDHRLAKEARICLPHLAEEKLLLLKEGHCFRNNALRLCQGARVNFVSVFESNQLSSILSMVAAGFGISLVPRMAAVPHEGCMFLPLERESYRRIGYMRARRHALGSAQKAFIGWLRAIARNQGRPLNV